MKKTKLLFSMLLAGCLVACGNNNPSNSSDNNSSNEPTSETTSTDGNSTSSTSSATPDSSTTSDTTIDAAVTEQKWQQILADFATTRNFSLQQSVNEVEIGSMKLVGTTYYDVVDGWETIYEIDGDNYYVYDKLSPNANWTKKKTTEQQYNYAVNTHACSMVLASTLAFGTNYSSFEYSNGAYVATKINVTEGLDLKDINVTLKNDKLDKVICTMVGTNENPDVLITVDQIGTTIIEIPNIQYISVESIKLSETEVTMEFNSSIMLTAEVYPADATESNIKWKSDNPKVVVVKDGNIVCGDIEGTATITATADGVSATCKVTVIPEFPLEEVTEEKWMESFKDMSALLENFSVINQDGEVILKADGMMYQNSLNDIYTSDGSNYYKFSISEDGWLRETIDENTYNSGIYILNLYRRLYPGFNFQNQYKKFTFENGIYHCDKLTSSQSQITNVDVAFKNGKLSYFKQGDTKNYAIYTNFGTTRIELPEKYIDIE